MGDNVYLKLIKKLQQYNIVIYKVYRGVDTNYYELHFKHRDESMINSSFENQEIIFSVSDPLFFKKEENVKRAIKRIDSEFLARSVTDYNSFLEWVDDNSTSEVETDIRDLL